MTERQKLKKLDWLPYHRALINDTSRLILVEKSRRIGFDYALAYKRTMERLAGKDRHLWYTSADESAAYEFIEYCKYFHSRNDAVLDSFEEHLPEAEDAKGSIKAFCLRFRNGARINALSSSPRRLRSKGGDVDISEFAFHDDAKALYAAAQPAIMWGDSMVIGSTHNGEQSVFNRFCKDAKDYDDGIKQRGSKPITPWSYHFVDIHTAIDQGLVELINRSRGTSFTRDGFATMLHAECATEDVWLQEFCCQPSTETSAWLPYDLIYTCEDSACPKIGEPLFASNSTGLRYAGIDVGRKKDLTVLWIVEQVGDVLWTRRILSLDNMPIPQQVRVLEGALREAKVVRTCVDATGLGIGLSDGLKERMGQYAIEAVTFTGPVKEVLAVPVRARFEDRSIRIPDDAAVREGLHKIRKQVTAAGNVRFDAARDDAGHADEFWAVALAIHAAGSAVTDAGIHVI